MRTCPVCGVSYDTRRKFCSRACVSQAYKLGLVVNSGNFKPGSTSLNKGRTLESWVREERAQEIKARMSINSRKKAVFLRKLNEDPNVLARKLKSRKFHDMVVAWLATRLREEGRRVFVLSEYIKEKRIPDAIVFDGRFLTAIEVETEKKWKPSHASSEERLSHLHSLSNFFDKTRVVFPSLGDSVDTLGPSYIAKIRS